LTCSRDRAWFEELPEFLVTTIRTAAPLLDHLVAVDGRYANFPGDVAASDPEQIAAIVYTCREHGIALSVHVPTEPWESEVAKRTRLFELGLDVADIGRSWLWVLDGDGFTTQLDITPDEVLALEHDVAEVRFIDPAEYADIRIRNLFRARPGLHVGPINHYTYRDGDGRVLWGRGEIEAADLGDRITMQHANHLRDEIRRQAGQAYYLRRTELGLEVGDCERCGERKASRSLPHRWRREGGRLRGEFGEFCDQCIHAIRRTNRASLALHGQDETMTVWINQQQFQLKALYWNWSASSPAPAGRSPTASPAATTRCSTAAITSRPASSSSPTAPHHDRRHPHDPGDPADQARAHVDRVRGGRGHRRDAPRRRLRRRHRPARGRRQSRRRAHRRRGVLVDRRGQAARARRERGPARAARLAQRRPAQGLTEPRGRTRSSGSREVYGRSVMRNRQCGPDDATAILADVVAGVSYKPGWTFVLADVDRGQGCGGLTLLIGARVPNSLDPSGSVDVLHLMPVLPAAYNREAWEFWVFEQILMVERHEAMEFYRVNGQAPYFSDHGPGMNPYALRRVKTPEERDTPAAPWWGGESTCPPA
jgi:hypothetical protein